jgi:tetratricopeptide (TPR) repeat protein
MARMICHPSGNYPKAIEESRRAIELDPDYAVAYSILARSYQYLGELDKAKQALQLAFDRKLEFDEFGVQRYDHAFLRGDPARMEEVTALARGKSDADGEITNHVAFAQAYTGHLAQARIAVRNAMDVARQSGKPETAALYEAGAALWEAFSEMHLMQRHTLWQRTQAPRRCMWTMAPLLRWPWRETPLELKFLPTISKTILVRIQQYDSITCPRSVHVSH